MASTDRHGVTEVGTSCWNVLTGMLRRRLGHALEDDHAACGAMHCCTQAALQGCCPTNRLVGAHDITLR